MKKQDSIEFDLRSPCVDYTNQFLATLAGFGFTVEDFQAKARAHYTQSYPNAAPSTIEAIIGYYMGAPMDQTKYIEALEILGGKATIRVALEPKTRVGQSFNNDRLRTVKHEFYDRPLDNLQLPTRVRSHLRHHFIFQFGQLARMSKEQLMQLVGEVDYHKVLEAMYANHILIGTDTLGWKSFAEKQFDDPIEKLGFDARTLNALYEVGCEYVGQLVMFNEQTVKGLKGIGDVRRNRLKAILKNTGLHLAMNVRGWTPPK